MFFGLLVLVLLIAHDALAQPTNFLIFIADDQGEGDLSIYGHPTLRTPNIDRLAREGMRFDNAFLTISSCSPSRSSILTGRYPHSTGAEDLHMPLPADQTTMARRLRRENYYNVSVGKWHLGDAEQNHWDVVVDCAGKETAAEAIKALSERPMDRPFFFWVASKDPHRPFDENAIPNPHRPADVVVPPYLPDHPLIRQDLALYYDEVTRFDTHVGEILAELGRQGVLDSTLIAYVSDNGMPFPRAKTTLYDSGIRTPMIVRLPGTVPAGSVQKGLFSVVDLAPTLLDVAGYGLDSAQGASAAAMLRNPEASGREAIYAEANWHDFEQFTRAVRTERFLLVRNYYWEKPLWNSVDSINSITWSGYLQAQRAGRLTEAQEFLFREPRPYEELYDLQVDPMSLRNLSDDPAYAAELNQLRTLMDNWRVDTKDTMPLEPRRDGWTRDGAPLPHNHPWYERYIEAGGRSSFERF
ncbi:MAG: sulfatase [Acidobacteriia bacterium]|nr:sulfatase [Terriglobia bacterium]